MYNKQNNKNPKFKLHKKLYFQMIPETYRVIVCLFAKSATAYNPFIYFFMFKGFRRDTMRVIKRLKNISTKLSQTK